jgi:hypothetical protein
MSASRKSLVDIELATVSAFEDGLVTTVPFSAVSSVTIPSLPQCPVIDVYVEQIPTPILFNMSLFNQPLFNQGSTLAGSTVLCLTSDYTAKYDTVLMELVITFPSNRTGKIAYAV